MANYFGVSIINQFRLFKIIAVTNGPFTDFNWQLPTQLTRKFIYPRLRIYGGNAINIAS